MDNQNKEYDTFPENPEDSEERPFGWLDTGPASRPSPGSPDTPDFQPASAHEFYDPAEFGLTDSEADQEFWAKSLGDRILADKYSEADELSARHDRLEISDHEFDERIAQIYTEIERRTNELGYSGQSAPPPPETGPAGERETET